jgi:hypothetical protein
MKQIKKKSNLKLLLVLLIISISGLVLLTVIQKRQDTRSNAAWLEDSLCKAIKGTCTADSIGACKTPAGLSGITVTNKCSGMYYNNKYCCVADNNGRGPGAEACVAKGGACQTDSKGYLPKVGSSCTLNGSRGTYKTGLCVGGYNNNHLCCIPTGTCASQGGVCISGVRNCTVGNGGRVLTGTNCSGSTPVCCVP